MNFNKAMISKLTKIYMLIFVLISIITITSAHPKGDQLRKLTQASDNGIINFTTSTFKEYVMKHPRPYDVVILFTLKYKCNLCEKVLKELSHVADSFREFDGYKPDMVNRKRAVFFGVIYYSEESSQIFKSLKLPTTTSILYTTPSNIQLDDNNEAYIKYDEDFVSAYKERSENVYAHKMLEFVNAKSGRKIELKKNPIVFVFYFCIFLSILGLGFYLFTHFKPFFLSPYLWLVGSFLVYIICIGGIVYNIIHGTPFAKFDREGRIVELIHSGQRSQYVGEGLLLSSLFVLTGTVLMALVWINKLKKTWHHRIASMVLIFFVVILSKLIISLYQKKASWYGPTFYPPNSYIKGPLIKDQGNSF
jgi:oligosaccharyltransferase complex subunit gamma